jgi:hypothetical protein
MICFRSRLATPGPSLPSYHEPSCTPINHHYRNYLRNAYDDDFSTQRRRHGSRRVEPQVCFVFLFFFTLLLIFYLFLDYNVVVVVIVHQHHHNYYHNYHRHHYRPPRHVTQSVSTTTSTCQTRLTPLPKHSTTANGYGQHHYDYHWHLT